MQGKTSQAKQSGKRFTGGLVCCSPHSMRAQGAGQPRSQRECETQPQDRAKHARKPALRRARTAPPPCGSHGSSDVPWNNTRTCQHVEQMPPSVPVGVDSHDGDGGAALETIELAWPRCLRDTPFAGAREVDCPLPFGQRANWCLFHAATCRGLEKTSARRAQHSVGIRAVCAAAMEAREWGEERLPRYLLVVRVVPRCPSLVQRAQAQARLRARRRACRGLLGCGRAGRPWREDAERPVGVLQRRRRPQPHRRHDRALGMAACRGGDLRRDALGRPRQRSAGGDADPRVFANVMNGRGRAPLFEVAIVHLELRAPCSSRESCQDVGSADRVQRTLTSPSDRLRPSSASTVPMSEAAASWTVDGAGTSAPASTSSVSTAGEPAASGLAGDGVEWVEERLPRGPASIGKGARQLPHEIVVGSADLA